MVLDAARLALVNAIGGIDWTKPEGRDAAGKRFWTLSFTPGQIPFETPSVATFRRVADPVVSSGEPPAPETRAADKSPKGGKRALIQGISSSSSVDFYGTEMSLQALTSMAAQMIRGISYLPRHNYGMFGASVEWDEVIGRTVGATVAPAQSVLNAYDPAEQQYILTTDTALYEDEPLAQALLRRVDREEPIGQSIGGWFTSLRIVQNEEGETERVIVLDVDLDHLVATRSPANPDADGIVSVRSVADAIRTVREDRGRLKLEDLQKIGRQTQEAERAGEDAPAEPVAPAEPSTEPAVDPAPEAEPRAEDGGPAEGGTTETDVQTHQKIQSDCARAERSGDRVVLSFDADASPEAIRVAIRRARGGHLGGDIARALSFDDGGTDPVPPASLDSDQMATYSPGTQVPSGADARGSALPVNPLDATPGADHLEDAMTPEQLRQILAESLAPLNQRLDAIDARTAPPPAAAPAPPAPAPAPAIDWEARAKSAERTVENLVRGERIGRSMPLDLPNGPAAADTFDGLVERAKESAPAMAAVAKHIRSHVVVDADDPEAQKVARRSFERDLAMMLNAAEADGIITDPLTRSIGAWR